ncbi:hypothetical protein H6P81_008838 [Aristolochia fimbriata]|uniref:Erect panicle 2 protein n=1 Tax=Aristolochia fimbriata TaxID=158543 RepID=A0AAV7EJD0_ARIFI|nr:hypothetical protein H6P81_008838 [Aristolochia fimbriata]
MHSRHRSPGDSVRSNSVAIGLSSSRISPEGSMRGHGMYASEYRSFNRGYGRGPPKAYPPPPPQPPRKGDIFMEAGRLAAEYLVSQGLLSPNSLPNKLQNGNIQDYRGHDRESLPQSEGRTSALSRLGNAVPEVGTSKKRFLDEFSSTSVRSHGRGRRRSGSFRGYGSEWGRENGRTESWPEKSRGFSDAQDTESSYGVGHQAERKVNLNAGSSVPRIAAEEIPLRNETRADSESELDNCERPFDTDSKENSSSRTKEVSLQMDTDSKKGLDDVRCLSLEAGELEDSNSEDKMNEKIEPEFSSVKETVPAEMAKQESSAELDQETVSTEVDLVRKGSRDLLSFCSFAKVPTKARSSLTPRTWKAEEDLSKGEKNNMPDTTHPNKGEKNNMSDTTYLSKGEKNNMPEITHLSKGEKNNISDTTHLSEGEKNNIPDTTHPSKGGKNNLPDTTHLSKGEMNNMPDPTHLSKGENYNMPDTTHPSDGEKNNMPDTSHLSQGDKNNMPDSSHLSLSEKNNMPDTSHLSLGEKNNNLPDTTARESQVLVEETFVGSSSDSLTNQTSNNSKSLTSNLSVPSIQSADEPADLETIFVLERERRARSQSFSDRPSFVHQQELGQGAPMYGRSRSMVITSNEGSLGQSLVALEGGAKRPREWDSEGDGYFHLHNVRARPSESLDRDIQRDRMTNAVDKKPLVEVALFPEASCQSSMASNEEKQHLPNSFKICDLNLTESSEMMDSPRAAVIGRIPDVQSTLGLQTDVSVDVGLSISNRFNNATGYGGRSSDSKGVVIVDVPDDDEPEKVFDTGPRKSETIYSNLENFLTHTENTVDLSNMPDSYGYAISELLGNDMPGCSSVPANMNDLQTDMTLHNQEVIPGGVDDPIYLSLGEIPISFLGVWDQSNQDYGKSF